MDQNLKLVAIYDALKEHIDAVDAKVSSLELNHGKDGKDGKDGAKGDKGDKGQDGQQGIAGKDGKDGRDGKDSPSIVDASIDLDNHLVISLSDGSEIDAGSLENIVSPETIANYVSHATINTGGGASVQFTEVTTTEYTVDADTLISGQNIFGVTASGDTTIYLPSGIDYDKMVVVSNETDSYNVTTLVI